MEQSVRSWKKLVGKNKRAIFLKFTVKYVVKLFKVFKYRKKKIKRMNN